MRFHGWLVPVAAVLGGCVLQVGDGEGEGGGKTSTTTAPSGWCGGVPTTGECVGDTGIRRCLVPEDYDAEPELIEASCDAGEVCQMLDGMAQCVPTGECYEGVSKCQDQQTLATCAGGKWALQSCGAGVECLAQPGQGAQCLSLAPADTFPLKGHLDYEYFKVRADLKGYEDKPSQEAAVDVFVTVLDKDELIGMGLTSAGQNGSPGDWQVQLSRKPSDQSFIYFWPILFDDNGFPFMAVAHPDGTDSTAQHSKEYWWWGFGPVCGSPGQCDTTDAGSQLVPASEGSGAMHLYQWMDYVLFRMRGLLTHKEPYSLVGFWEDGKEFGCGTCMVPPGYGLSVTFDEQKGLKDKYQTGVIIEGPADSPLQWSRSVILHEIGHYLHYSYSKYPGEAGPHSVSKATPPGMAFAEGFATFSGQTHMSASPADPNPIYFAKQSGTNWYMNLAKTQYYTSSPPKPDPSAGMDQPLSELVVASMMWSLWASAQAENPQGLGDVPLFKGLASARLASDLNRGYHTRDLVDFLDGMKCDKLATAAQIDAVTKPMGYPYDNQEICP